MKKIAVAAAMLLLSQSPVFANQCTSGVKEIVFSARDLQAYKRTCTSPDVQYLRKAFNAFLQGKMGGGASSDDEYEPLKKFDRSYYKSKFSVLTMRKDIGGSWQIDIIFQNKPDKVFRVITYGGFELRGYEDTQISECELSKLKIKYRGVLSNKKLGI